MTRIRHSRKPAHPEIPVRCRRAGRRRAHAGVLLALVIVCGQVVPSSAKDLYTTDFEGFTAGPDNWVGTDGWQGNNNRAQVHGIDEGVVSGLGKTAYLGYYPPPTALTTVFRPVAYDPVASNTPVIEFETLLGIQDSTNGRGDSFRFTFYNALGAFLAAVRFSNNPLFPGIWRMDGSSEFATGVGFYPGQLHLLFCEIDFSANRWSADLDGIPLFTNAVFNATGVSLDLYATAAEWSLTAGSTNLYGDNWLLVADWAVRAIPAGESPVVIRNIAPAAGGVAVSWLGEPGFTYDVYADAGLSNGDSSSPPHQATQS